MTTWYEDGLRFACARCGNCCSGKGSVVVVTDREVEALARVTGLSPAEFRARHTRESMGDTVLVDREDGACEWLVRNPDGTSSCRVQEGKPDQCRSYPFWPRILRSRAAWEAEGRKCRGIGRGDVIPAWEIDRRAGLDDLRAAVDLLLDELDAEVRDMGAVCWVSGDCCDFPRAGHRLFATRVEAERFAAGVDLAAWDPATGLCPAWKGGRCTARAHRPSACRTFHCDPNFDERVSELTERAVTRLKWLHERHHVPWDYRDWIDLLAELRGERGTSPPGDSGPSPADDAADNAR
jgi:Fe-S-cluster containining protein